MSDPLSAYNAIVTAVLSRFSFYNPARWVNFQWRDSPSCRKMSCFGSNIRSLPDVNFFNRWHRSPDRKNEEIDEIRGWGGANAFALGACPAPFPHLGPGPPKRRSSGFDKRKQRQENQDYLFWRITRQDGRSKVRRASTATPTHKQRENKEKKRKKGSRGYN